MFKIQIFHPASGFYLNTNHESEDLEVLKSLLKEPTFTGPRFQIVDQDGAVHYGPIAIEREGPISLDDLAQSFGVPVLDPRDIGLVDEVSSDTSSMTDIGYGYTLEAVHERDGKGIVSLRLEEANAHEIMRELWADVDFWAAPSGGSMLLRAQAEAETINRVLRTTWITFEPDRHRWLFHVHLV